MGLAAPRRLAARLFPNDPGPYDTVRQGMLGSVLIMVGSWGVGWLPHVPESVLARSRLLLAVRVDLVGVVVCTVFLALGSMLLVRSWLRLGQQLDGRWTTHGVAARRAALRWAVPLLAALPIFSRDVFSYVQQGRMVAVGLDPYTTGVSAVPGWFMHGADSLWAESPSPYGPLFLWAAEGIWLVSDGRPEVSTLLFRGIAVVGMAMCLWAVPRLARAAGRDPDRAVWLSITNPLFLLYMIGAAHNDALMMGLMLAGFVLLVRPGRRRPQALAGLVLICLSVAIKPLTILMLPFAALLLPAGWAPWTTGRGMPVRARFGPWITTAVLAVAVLAVLGQLSGLGFGWIAAMLTSGDAAFPYAPFGLIGLGVGALVDLATALDARTVAGWCYTAGTVCALAYTAYSGLRRHVSDPVWTSAAVLFVAVVVAPIIQPWYLVWLLPLVAACLPGRLEHPRWFGPVLAGSVLLLTGVGVVDQIAVFQWIPHVPVRLLAAAIVLACLAYIVWWDPHTSRVFRSSARPAPQEVL